MNYFHSRNKQQILDTCPAMNKMFKYVNTGLDILVNKIIQRLKGNTLNSTQTRMDILADFFMTHIGTNISPVNPNAKSLIYDYVISPKYMTAYKELFLK